MIAPRHDRYGYVADSSLAAVGNLSSFVLRDTDNDGLWTGMYAASQAFRYATTGDPAARAEALLRYRALHFLFEATTDLPLRFPARSVARVGDPIASGPSDPFDCKASPHCWRNSTTAPGWVWKADTSSDEVTGHIFCYAVLYRLLQVRDAVTSPCRVLSYFAPCGPHHD